ncbi:hypothetical protein BC332_33301 [Capsicum chinense]|nr:hypothetical protein BC332_33301 [Capsicum chinense]
MAMQPYTTPNLQSHLRPPNSKKQKKGVCVFWVQMDSCADTWTPFIDGDMVREGEREEWDAVFSAVSQRNANEEAVI